MPHPRSIGNYAVTRRIAVGGMAEVYLARGRTRTGLLALKRVRPRFLGRLDYVSMFRDEVRILANLAHPNISRLFDDHSNDVTPYCTMEYVDGLSVREILKLASQTGMAMPMDCAVSIIRECAAALHYAHERRSPSGAPLHIVHRDIAPSNVLLGRQGQVKVIDFGVAKAAGRQTQTRAWTIKGRLGYMSPEQCLCRPVRRGSDIFSLGVLLYEMTTGRRAFSGTRYQVVTQTTQIGALQPSLIVPGYPAHLEAITMKAMRRRSWNRHASMLAFQTALEEFAASADLDLSSAKRGGYLRALVRAAAGSATHH